MATASINLVEIRAVEPLGSDAKVDRAAGVIRGVKVMGTKSPNRVNGKPTRYLESAFQNAVSLYEGAAVYADHPDRDTPAAARRYEDRLGRLENVRAEAGGLRGDLRLNKAHRLAAQVFEDAEMGSSVGLSHNAQGAGAVSGNEFVVESIKAVRSVDLVAEPATTRSLFESKEAQMSAPTAPATQTPAPDAPAVTVTTGTTTQAVVVTEERKPEASPLALLEERIAQLERENDTLKAAAATREREARVEALLAEAKLPAVAVTQKFRETLVAAKDEAEVKALIEDRRVAVRVSYHQNPSSTPPTGGSHIKPVETAADFVESLRKSGGRS